MLKILKLIFPFIYGLLYIPFPGDYVHTSLIPYM